MINKSFWGAEKTYAFSDNCEAVDANKFQEWESKYILKDR